MVLPFFLLALSIDAQDVGDLSALIDQAADPDGEVHQSGLAKLRNLIAGRVDDIRAMLKDPDQADKAKLALFVARDSKNPSPFTDMLALSEPKYRIVAIRSLSPTEGQKYADDLEKLFSHKDVQIALAAAAALAACPDETTKGRWSKSVLALYGKGNPQNPLIHACFLACGSPETWQGFGLGKIAQCLNPKTAGDRHAAILALTTAEAASPVRFQSVERFGGALKDPNLDLGDARLLLSFVRRNKTRLLPQFLCHPKPQVRALVVEQIDRELSNPFLVRSLVEVLKDTRINEVDDGGKPATSIASRVKAWLSKISGIEGGTEQYEAWLKAGYRDLLTKAIDKSIEAGVAQVKQVGTKRSPPGNSTGYDELLAYTLIKCDVDPTDPLPARLVAQIESTQPRRTYALGLAAMAWSALIAKMPEGEVRKRYAKRLQGVADSLASAQYASGAWDYGDWKGSKDFSNTQFAILGLRAAVNVGAKVPREVWERALRLYQKMEAKDGGWGYWDQSPTMSMTTAGLGAVAILKKTLDPALTREMLVKDPTIVRAIQWVQKYWNTNLTGWGYYWLYSLERSCMVADLQEIGNHDWYYEVAECLLARQEKNGSWDAGRGDRSMVDTCFALLFLKRAFVAVPFIATGDTKRTKEVPAGGEKSK